MSIKIDLPGEVYHAAKQKIGFDEEIGAIFNAILEAMVEYGMATHVDCTDADDQVRPMLLIRLDGGKN